MSALIPSRKHAAQLLAALADVPGPQDDDSVCEVVTDGRWEVTIVVRPARYTATIGGAEIMSVRDAIREFLSRPPTEAATAAASPPPRAHVLEQVHQRVLAVLSDVPQKSRTIARKAGYSPTTAKVRLALAELVRLGLARHVEGDGYAKV